MPSRKLSDSLRPLEGGAVEPRVEERVADLRVALRPVHRDGPICRLVKMFELILSSASA
jgi:hypothetical protein